MNLEFIANAGCIFTGSKGTRILCDPWIIDGVFNGSWYHYPPLKTKISDIQNVDAIYVSHIHPDHYDDRYFNFPKNIPLIVLDAGPNFLKKNLINRGYDNFIEIKNDQTKEFNEFNLTMYKPFSKHIFEESLLGNIIDSSIVLNDGDITAINFNDNTPDEASCSFLFNKFKKIDLAMLNYNCAGPYPSCFDNLNKQEKINEHRKLLNRNFNHLCNIIPILQARSVLPFAGSYIIAGSNSEKNEYLGTTTIDECSDYLEENLDFNSKIVCLRENQTFNIKTQEQPEEYERINLQEMQKYIKSIKDKKYDFEEDEMPEISKLIEDLQTSSEKLIERVNKFNVKLQSNVFIEVNDKNIQVVKGEDSNRNLNCKLDLRLLRKILDKEAHWNNAEIGTHISFYRTPNKMDTDVHTCMSFLHL